MFIDKVVVKFAAGKGGDGIIAGRREKFVPKGGPSGGNGGDGGSIFLQADARLSSLDNFRNQSIVKAKNGSPGGPQCKRGKDGNDLVLKLPMGTLVKNASTQEILWECLDEEGSLCLCKGGRGGKGNAVFKSSIRRMPLICTKGKPGEEITIELELKLIADIGLIGFPNAGKSSLLTALTQRKIAIAPYPFTTLKPNLGYIHNDTYERIWLADIPGIIENAHKNRGLGLEFLRHIERTKLLLYVIDISGMEGRTPYQDFLTLQEELLHYNPEILQKPFFIVLNKTDINASNDAFIAPFFENPSIKEKIFLTSAIQKNGLKPLLHTLKTLSTTPIKENVL